jgi:cytochrome c peroxidase
MKFAFVTILLIIAITIWGFSSTEQLYSKASLGKLLFNEKILSKDSSVSCSSCHNPNLGFADTLPFSVGVRGQLTKRNTPSVLNMKNRPYYFWDGISSSLEEQSLMPIQNPDEMGLSIKEAVYRLNQSSFYKKQFQLVFNSDPNQMNLAAAIAAFESTLETSDSKFDDWANNKTRLTASEERGRQVFLSNKAKCFECHFQIDFTNDDFKNIGLFNGNNFNDSGRFLITRDKDDLGKFKTPGLRNIAITSPYMHNGIFKTLEEVVDYYNDVKKIVPDTKNLDPTLSKPLGLTNQQKKDLVAFLKTLTDKRYAKN